MLENKNNLLQIIFFVEFLITHNITSYSYNLNLTIKNITKKDDGEYVCKADKSNTQNSVYTLYQVVVNSQYFFIKKKDNELITI